MRYEPFTPMAGISLSELTRRLSHELDELIEDRPIGVSRREVALAIQAKATAVLSEEESPAYAFADLKASAGAVCSE